MKHVPTSMEKPAPSRKKGEVLIRVGYAGVELGHEPLAVTQDFLADVRKPGEGEEGGGRSGLHPDAEDCKGGHAATEDFTRRRLIGSSRIAHSPFKTKS